MAEQTGISWCHHTFNAWVGCTKVSPGCKFCYAETMNKFFKWNRAGWGPGAPRKRTSDALWRQPLAWNLKAAKAGERRRVFVNSLSDVCDDHPSIQRQWRDDLISLVRRCESLDFLFLTKRPENLVLFYEPLPNLWAGTTVENQNHVWRISELETFGAPVHFLSCEPLLGPVNLDILGSSADWVIVGGESGPNARPFDSRWAEQIRQECAYAGVKFYFKQHGGNRKIDGVYGGDLLDGVRYHELPGGAAKEQ